MYLSRIIILLLLPVVALAGIPAANKAPSQNFFIFEKSSNEGLYDSTRNTSLSIQDQHNSPAQLSYRVNPKIKSCERCHSEELVISNRYLPVLQGQNYTFLYQKIKTIKNDPASIHPFPSDSRGLSEQDIQQISRYYSIQRSHINDQWIAEIFDSETQPIPLFEPVLACLKCHGMNAKGVEAIPALSGQNENYLSYRIREISRDASKINMHDDGLIQCQIPQLDIHQSRLIAQVLGLVVNKQKVQDGKRVYFQKCAVCHNHGYSDAPILGKTEQWNDRLERGINELIRAITTGFHRTKHATVHPLSHPQFVNAVHFMLHEIGMLSAGAQN